jgi:hypothetical protein
MLQPRISALLQITKKNSRIFRFIRVFRVRRSVVVAGLPREARLLDPSRQEDDELLVGQTLESADRQIHGDFAAVVALKRDSYTDGLYPSIPLAIGPRRFERTPIKTSSICETAH